MEHQDPDHNYNSVPSGCPGMETSIAGTSSACEGCPNQKLCSSGEAKNEMDKVFESLSKKYETTKKIVLVMSGKGGVGKSTLAMLLARSLVHFNGSSVGFLDIDICGPSAGRLFGVEGEIHKSSLGLSPLLSDDGIAVMSSQFMLGSKTDAIIWRGAKKNSLIKELVLNVDWGVDLDYLIIDTPPGTTDEHLSLVGLVKNLPQVCALMVYTSQEVALLDVRKQINFVKMSNIPIIGYVQNMSCVICPNCHKQSSLFPTSQNNQGTVTHIKPLCILPIFKEISFCEAKSLNLFEYIIDKDHELIKLLKGLSEYFS